MNAAVKNPPAEFLPCDGWGRRIRCVSCGVKLKHPLRGRPRIHCGRQQCANARKRVRAKKRQLRFSAHDRAEAVGLWGDCCAICRCEPLALGFRNDVLPVCWDCRRIELSPTAKRWIARCKPGCPLPNPFVGGAK